MRTLGADRDADDSGGRPQGVCAPKLYTMSVAHVLLVHHELTEVSYMIVALEGVY